MNSRFSGHQINESIELFNEPFSCYESNEFVNSKSHASKTNNGAEQVIPEQISPRKQPESNKPNFVPHKSFPSMSEALSREENKIFGVHIVAALISREGRKLVASAPFAAVEYVSSSSTCCFNCGKDSNLRMECKHCINIWFCSQKCSLNKHHKKVCNPIHHKSDCKIVRLATKIMHVAVKKFANIDMFSKFSSEVMMQNKTTYNISPPYSEYGEILKLKCYPEEQNFTMAKRVAKLLKLLPEFSEFTYNYRNSFYIAYCHITCIALNSFFEQKRIAKGGSLKSFHIFDIMSRFNHSCKQNVVHYIDDDNMTYCEATADFH